MKCVSPNRKHRCFRSCRGIIIVRTTQYETRVSYPRVAIPSESSDRKRLLNSKVTRVVTFGTLRYHLFVPKNKLVTSVIKSAGETNQKREEGHKQADEPL